MKKNVSVAWTNLRLWKNSMQLAPALLEHTFEDFARDVKKIEGLFEYAQIDIMDGGFVPTTSFGDIEKINELHSPLKWELHLMVTNPLAEMQKWQEIKNIFRVIFHIESSSDPAACIAFARGKCWEVGIALNPKTELVKVEPYYEQIDVVQFMTVVPGRQGGAFIPEVGEKIAEFSTLKKRPLCAVDGAVSEHTIPALTSWGVEIFNVGSALLKAPNTVEAFQKLTTTLKI